MGKVISSSEPFFLGSAASQWNTISYDQYGREVSTVDFRGKMITTTYNGLVVTTDDGIRSATVKRDAFGNIIFVSDDGGDIEYTYFSNGVVKTSNYGGHIILTEIDDWGRKSFMYDPNTEEYNYEYDLLGRMLSKTSPKGRTTYEYNNDGLLEKRLSAVT